MNSWQRRTKLLMTTGLLTVALNKLIWVGSITAAVHLLDRRGHRHWARGLAFLGGGAAGFAAWHNMGVNGQTPR
jgi:hypothetical protein